MKLYPLGMLKCPAMHSHSPETRGTCIGPICIAFKQKWKQIIKKMTPNKLPDRTNILRLVKRPPMRPAGSMCVTATASPYKAENTRGRREMDVCVRFNRHSGAAPPPTFGVQHFHMWRWHTHPFTDAYTLQDRWIHALCSHSHTIFHRT